MTPRRFAALLPALLLAGVAAAAESTESAELAGESAFDAGAFTGTAEDMSSFVEEWLEADWDVSKAARVEGMKLQRDAGEIQLDGWLFLREDVRGIVANARFFGDGRFKLTPPIPMERQQVQRFLGKESLDETFDSASLEFTGLEDQKLFASLDWSEAEAAKATEENEDAKEFVENVEKWEESGGLTEEERQRALYGTYFTALNLYERVLDPDKEGSFGADMSLDLGDDRDHSKAQLVSLAFEYQPERFEDVSVVGTWDHGRRNARSLITRFSRSDLYDEALAYAATSPALEKRELEILDLLHTDMRLHIDPTNAADTTIRSTQQLRVLAPEIKLIAASITPFMEATGAKIDGKPVDFLQPEVPNQPWLHAPAIAILLPKALKKGDEFELSLEMNGSILDNYDGGFTWIVKAEDNWFPRPYTGGIDTVSSTFDTTITVPKKFTAVSNGAITDCRDEDTGSGRECFRYVTKHPMDFPFFNVGKSIGIDSGETPAGSKVAVYTNKESKVEFRFRNENGTLQTRRYNLSKMGPNILAKTVAAMTIYEEWFGEYPYARLAVTPHPKSHGRGSAGVLLLWDRTFLTPTARGEMEAVGWRQPEERWFDFFVSHETAHQWWGNIAGIRADRDQWFSEGFANYGSIIYMEAIDQAKGRDREWTMAELRDWHDFLTRDDGYVNTIAPLCLGNRVASAQNRSGYENVRQPYMYDKGGYVMHMLRTVARALKGDPQTGDELFRQGVQDFIEAHYLDHPSNFDLERSFSKSFGVDLSWFFKQWVYGTGIPKADFSYDVAKNASGQTMLRGRIVQEDTEFVFPVAITLHYGQGKNAEAPYFYTWVQQPDQSFEVPLPAAPDSVTINDDLGVLAILETVPWQAPAAAGQ